MSTMMATQPRPSYTSLSQSQSSSVPRNECYRILIASVQALLREGLRSAFESRPECTAVLEAASLPQVVRAFELRAIDVLLLDCDLAGHTAVAFVQSSPIAGAGIPILILASPSNRILARQLLTAGAAGVVWKRSGIQELRSSIREAIAQKTWRDCRTLCPRESIQSIVPPPWGTFTDRQKKVLQGVLQGRGNKEIATDLWVTEVSVKCTMRQLFAKTKTHSRAQLVMALLEHLPLDELNEPGRRP
jgi:two-component system nitrate/nitrite response regulator NarL